MASFDEVTFSRFLWALQAEGSRSRLFSAARAWSAARPTLFPRRTMEVPTQRTRRTRRAPTLGLTRRQAIPVRTRTSATAHRTGAGAAIAPPSGSSALGGTARAVSCARPVAPRFNSLCAPVSKAAAFVGESGRWAATSTRSARPGIPAAWSMPVCPARRVLALRPAPSNALGRSP